MEQINIYSGERVISRIVVERTVAALEPCLEKYQHVFVVMDSNVAMNCPAAAQIAQIMNRKGAPGRLIDASEEAKTMETVMDICGWLLDNGADRDALILAVGGGITTDMVGFAASIYKRGVRFAYVPTTLLAQVDASIGGKTGANFDNYKNMLGVIRQPEFTFVCPQVLESLPHREFTAGVAEMLKTFMIEDDGNYQKAVDVLSEMQQGYSILPPESAEDYWTDCVSAYSDELLYLINEAVRVKAGVVSRDQYERGERRKLNLGHTFAHAIEKCEPKFNHGEAVAVGILIACRIATRLGLMREEEVALIARVIGEHQLPLSAPPYLIPKFLRAIAKDKKRAGDRLSVILPQGIGSCTIRSMTFEELSELFPKECGYC
jgi:3-dehydroquinate synthase